MLFMPTIQPDTCPLIDIESVYFERMATIGREPTSLLFEGTATLPVSRDKIAHIRQLLANTERLQAMLENGIVYAERRAA